MERGTLICLGIILLITVLYIFTPFFIQSYFWSKQRTTRVGKTLLKVPFPWVSTADDKTVAAMLDGRHTILAHSYEANIRITRLEGISNPAKDHWAFLSPMYSKVVERAPSDVKVIKNGQVDASCKIWNADNNGYLFVQCYEKNSTLAFDFAGSESDAESLYGMIESIRLDNQPAR
jgi:hypothetical protein